MCVLRSLLASRVTAGRAGEPGELAGPEHVSEDHCGVPAVPTPARWTGNVANCRAHGRNPEDLQK